MQFRFSDHILDVERRELRRNGQLVPMEPQVFDLLLHLLRNRDRVVTKDDLLTAVWDGRIVSESTLTSRINAARKAIGDSGVAQRLIRTVPRKGLRFVADVATDHPVEPLTSSPTRDRPSIAVLRFANLSEDPEQEYFAEGIVEELITGLSRIKWLLVISRHSAFAHESGPFDIKTIGRGLGVRYVLEGSVRRAGEKVRVTGQLTETETGRHVWAGRFDGTWGDIFTLQDEMTMSVIGAVEPSLRRVETERARRKRPDSLDAYDLFLRALPFAATAMPDNADAALSLLERAIGLEPDYAVAHGMAAWCHEQRYLRAGLHAANREAPTARPRRTHTGQRRCDGPRPWRIRGRGDGARLRHRHRRTRRRPGPEPFLLPSVRLQCHRPRLDGRQRHCHRAWPARHPTQPL